MLEKLYSLGNDFFVQDDRGLRAFLVDRKSLRLRGILVFRDLQGNELCRIRQQTARAPDLMVIDDPAGRQQANIQRAMIAPLRVRFDVQFGEGKVLEVRGDLAAFEYQIGEVAKVSRAWFRMRDSYGVEVAEGQDVAPILAATVCIEQMTGDEI